MLQRKKTRRKVMQGTKEKKPYEIPTIQAYSTDKDSKEIKETPIAMKVEIRNFSN